MKKLEFIQKIYKLFLKNAKKISSTEMRSRVDINERKSCILVRSSASLLYIWFRDIQALWSTM
jgi:hypothetical protein